MKLGSVIAILSVAALIVMGEWKAASPKKAKPVMAGITLLSVILALLLLFQPHMPGPTQFVKLVFGKMDKYVK